MSDASYFMTRVHNTYASGASAMPVPGWPEFAAWGPSMQRPRMTLIARCSRSVSVTVALTGATLPRTSVEEEHGCGEAVQEAAIADRADLAGTEHAGGRAAVDVRVHDERVVIGCAEQMRAAAV